MVNRAWSDRNNNFVPDCDLLNPANQTTTIDTCAQISDLAFGQNKFTQDLADKLRSGWGVRSGDWQYGVSVQQEVLPRVSIEVGYNRRWLTNFTVTDNTLQAPTDFGTFSIVAPVDSRLPAQASGRTISGLYNVNQDRASAVGEVQTLGNDFGTYSQNTHGILFNVSARPRNGLVFQGGAGTGTTRTNYCDMRTALPEQLTLGPPTPLGFSPTNPWCNTSTGWVSRYTGLGSYTLPKVDVLLSGTFRSDRGAPLMANFIVPSAVVAQSLGRPLSNNAPNVTVNLVEPGTLYGDRVNEIDLRLAKILRFGRTRTNVGFDVYNILNSAAILTYNQSFSAAILSGPGAWQQPTGVLQPRFWKFSVQVDF
jgi:hypothetical protein